MRILRTIAERIGLWLLARSGWTVRTVAREEYEKVVFDSGNRYAIAPEVNVHVHRPLTGSNP